MDIVSIPICLFDIKRYLTSYRTSFYITRLSTNHLITHGIMSQIFKEDGTVGMIEIHLRKCSARLHNLGKSPEFYQIRRSIVFMDEVNVGKVIYLYSVSQSLEILRCSYRCTNYQ